MRSTRALLSSLMLLVVLPVVGLACSVPVFRYAIEHWHPDGYVVRVFYQGKLTEDQQQILKELRGNVSSDTKPNINLMLVDIDQPIEGESAEIWKAHRTEKTPAMLVHMPASAPSRDIPVWKGELTAANVQAIVRSPLRQQIEKRLVDGESVVWVQLDSGNAEKDDAAFELLQKELQRLEKAIELPKIEEADLSSLSVPPQELKIRFSALRVPADNTQENVLREMMRSVEADLRDESVRHLTMAIPVFGRGRALYALTGDGINSTTIEDACRFLTGACQCTVKAENPGVDLLLAANWEALITVSEPKEVDVELVGLGLAANPESSASSGKEQSPPTELDTAAQHASVSSTPTVEAGDASVTSRGLQPGVVTDSVPATGVSLLTLALGTVGVAAIFLFGLLLLVRRPS